MRFFHQVAMGFVLATAFFIGCFISFSRDPIGWIAWMKEPILILIVSIALGIKSGWAWPGHGRRRTRRSPSRD